MTASAQVIPLRPGDDPRRFTVGGSDVAAAAGVHPYTSAVALWCEKTGRVDTVENERMRWGKLLEPLIELEVAETVGLVSPGPIELVDSDRPWATGTLDGFVEDDEGRAVGEWKTAGSWAHDRWGDDVPIHYAAQCQWYMHLSGLPRAILAVLVGGQRLEVRTVRRSDKAIRLLLEAGERFHWHLVTDTPPPPDGSRASRDALLALSPEHKPGRVHRLTAAEWRTFKEMRDLRTRRDAIESQIAERENLLRAALDDAEIALSPADQEVITYRAHDSQRINSARLRKDLPDIAEQYTTTVKQRPFRVTGDTR